VKYLTKRTRWNQTRFDFRARNAKNLGEDTTNT